MTVEFLIPVTPAIADAPTEIANLAPGVSLDGVTIEFPADVDTIESNYNIPPFDFCGGHVNFRVKRPPRGHFVAAPSEESC